MRRHFHPGFYLKENTECTGSTIDDLARRLGISVFDCQRLFDGHKDIDRPLAEKIAALYGTSVDFWLNLQAAYDNRSWSD